MQWLFVALVIGAVVLAFSWYMLFHKLWMPIPPAYEDGIGLKFSQQLAKDAQHLSYALLMLGWFFVATGALSGIAATIFGSDSVPENAHIWAVLGSQKGLLCGAIAVVSTGIGWQIIDRSKSATKTASVATAAIATATMVDSENLSARDREAYDACVQAKAAWLAGRMSHDRLDNLVVSLEGTANQGG